MASTTSSVRYPQSFVRTYVAGGTIVANKFVKYASDGDVEQSDAANEFIGVALNAAVAGEQVAVCVAGPCEVVFGAATDLSATEGPFFLSCDAQAKAIAATAGSIQAGFAVMDPKNGTAFADQELGLIYLTPQNADAA